MLGPLLREFRRGREDLVSERRAVGLGAGPGLYAELVGRSLRSAAQIGNARWRLRAATSLGRGVQVRGRLRVDAGGELRIGDGVKLWSHILRTHISCPRGGRLQIGEGTFINVGSVVSAHREVRIGARCQIGNLVVIMDSDFHDVTEHDVRPAPVPVAIGDDVWIAMRSTVLKGVTIGDGAVVAAHSLVVDDVPAHTVVAGAPAKVVRELTRRA